MKAAPVPTEVARTGCGGFTDEKENLSTTCRQSNSLLKDDARFLYSTEEVRRDMRRPLPPHQSEDFDDVILLASYLLTGQIGDLSDSLEWFGERIALDYPDRLSTPHVVPLSLHQADHLVAPIKEPSAPSRRIQTTIKSSSRDPVGKNTDNVTPKEKTPTTVRRKTLTMVKEKTPTYTVPVLLWVVVSYERLKERLIEQNQEEWNSTVRRLGLMILLDFIYRHKKSKGVFISHDLASGYVSELNRPKNKTTLRQPLAVLVELGILEILEQYKCGPHQRQSTRYRLAPALRKKAVQQDVMLTPKLVEKRLQAEPRQQKRLNKNYSWREQLLHDIGTVSLTQVGMSLSMDLLADNKLAQSIKKMHDVLLKRVKAYASVDSFETILNDIKNFPRLLKPHLTLAGSNVALCDITHAHWCLLPLLLEKRIQGMRDAGCGDDQMGAFQHEQQRLQAYLSEGDLYRKLSDNPDSDIEREKTKKKMLTALNLKNNWNHQCAPYQRMKVLFPHTFDALEWVKRENHKAINPFLLNNTAVIITQSLLRCQDLGISAIPDTDCLICPEEHKATVCRVIGEEMFRHTGVQCRVGDIRFKRSVGSNAPTSQPHTV